MRAYKLNEQIVIWKLFQQVSSGVPPVGPYDQSIVFGNGCITAKPRPPCCIVENTVHDPADSFSLVRLIDKPANEALAIPETTQKEIANKLFIAEHPEHKKG